MPSIPAKITGVAGYVPPRVMTNYDLEKIIETSHDWIVERTGITERHVVDKGMATSCIEVLEEAEVVDGIDPADVLAESEVDAEPDAALDAAADIEPDEESTELGDDTPDDAGEGEAGDDIGEGIAIEDMDIDQLREELKERDIQFDPRTGEKKLRAKLAEAIKAEADIDDAGEGEAGEE